MKIKNRLDVVDSGVELNTLHDKIHILGHRLQAIGIDYNNYISPDAISSTHSKRIHELCGSLNLRLSSVFFHVELFCNYFESIEDNIKNRSNDQHEYLLLETARLHFLFDSIIYHISSVYDYLATLINFIHDYGSTEYKKWNSIGKSTKKNESTYKLTVKIHNDYVNHFFKFRSSLIHEKVNLVTPTLTTNFIKEENRIFIPTSKFMLKSFKDLLDLSHDNEISLRYSMFSLNNHLVSHTNDILFELRDYMNNNKKDDRPYLFVKQDGNQISALSASEMFWHDDLR